MSDYRLYSIDGAGHIGLADWFAAGSDDDAIMKARMHRANGARCEVWQKSRLVAKLNSNGEVERF
jgi:hypothetical protein